MAGISRAYKRRGNMVAMTGGPVLCLDAGSKISYPGSGTTWTDLSGNANTGTLVNGPTFDSANGGSIVFDGVNDYVQASAISQTPRTVLYWFKPTVTITSSGPIYGLMDFGNVKNYDLFGFTGDITGSIGGETIFWGSDWNSGGKITYIKNTIDTNWHHLAITNTATVWDQVYLDGVAVTTFFMGGGCGIWNADFTIGKGNWVADYFFSGRFSTVSIYSRALSAAEITTNFELTRGRYGI